MRRCLNYLNLNYRCIGTWDRQSHQPFSALIMNPIMHQSAKCQQSNGCLNYWRFYQYSGQSSRGPMSCSCVRDEWAKYGHYIGRSWPVHKFVLDLKYVAPFRKDGHSKATAVKCRGQISHFSPRLKVMERWDCKMSESIVMLNVESNVWKLMFLTAVAPRSWRF